MAACCQACSVEIGKQVPPERAKKLPGRFFALEGEETPREIFRPSHNKEALHVSERSDCARRARRLARALQPGRAVKEVAGWARRLSYARERACSASARSWVARWRVLRARISERSRTWWSILFGERWPTRSFRSADSWEWGTSFSPCPFR